MWILTEQPPLVLIATVNAPTRVALARLVTRRGMTALACFDGAAALAYVYAQRSEVQGAIVDLHLPSMDGESLAHTLRDEGEGVATFVLRGGAGEGVTMHPSYNRAELSPDELAQIDVWLQRLVPSVPTPHAASELGERETIS